jgi:hypothetical protein
MRVPAGFLPAAMLLCALPAKADASAASARAVVLNFDGRGGAQARVAVVRAVSGTLDLEPRREVQATARRAGADLGSASGRARVAQAHDLQLILSGRVEGRGAGTRVHILIHDGRGDEIASREVKVPPTARGRRALTEAAKGAVDDALRVLRSRRPIASTPPAGHDAPEAAAEPHEGDAPGVHPRSPLITVLAGVGGRTRRAEVELTSGARRRYESGVFLEIPVHLDVRPLAGRGGRAASGFAIQADFAMAAALSSVEQATGNQVDTQAYRFAIHTGYIYPFDRGGLGVLAGYHHEVFDLGANPVLPSSAYPTLRAAVTGRYDILGPLLYARLDAGFRYLLGLGGLATAFGADADGLGFDAQATLGGTHRSGFSYALRLTVEHAILRFDGDADDEPGHRGTELGFALGALVGWGF